MATMFESIEGWFDFDDIYELALRRSSAHKHVRFVEIGAYEGRTACYLAERIAETGKPVHFDVVDTFAGAARAREICVMPDNRFFVGLVHSANTSAKQVRDPRWRRCDVGAVRELIGDAWPRS